MKSEEKTIKSYEISVDNIPVRIEVVKSPDDFVPLYKARFPHIEVATKAVLATIREKIITDVSIRPVEILNIDEITTLKVKFVELATKYVKEELPHMDENTQKILAGLLVHNSLGLGPLEILLADSNVEEIVINNSKEPIWVYDMKIGWLKSNIVIENEIDIYNYSALIGRRVGTQITNLNPLMDAYLTSGDRANATLFPISSKGNTLTIRKFARRPWTITDFIDDGSISLDAAAFLWLAIQYELNILIAGGTASGKTSLLSVLSCFIPPTHRVISIEDTREMQLPRFMHWVPMTTRPPNPEGRGEITMLQLMINALRMRPDRILVGEIRRSAEAEVLFEAIHTGHSVYATVHANTAEETYRRMVNPPINIPPSMMSSLQLIAVMHRDRRKNARRLLQVAELICSTTLDQIKIELNTIFRWVPSKDKVMMWGKSHRLLNDIKLFTGMDEREIDKNLKEKQEILQWLHKNNIRDVHEVGRIISEYYIDSQGVLDVVRKGAYKPQKKKKA